MIGTVLAYYFLFRPPACLGHMNGENKNGRAGEAGGVGMHFVVVKSG